MKKKMLGVFVSLLAVAMLALPMISAVQAKEGGIPAENYQDLQIWGFVLADGPADIDVNGKIQYGTYTTKMYNSMTPDVEWVGIFWNGVPFVDAESLMGTATGDVEYKINTDTGMGVVHISVVITVPEGTFEGDVLWVGEFALAPDNTLYFVKIMWHAVYDGTGDYEGWKIVINSNGRPSWGPPTSYTFAGSSHLLKPKLNIIAIFLLLHSLFFFSLQ
jgi:hypothetical protein